MVNGDQFKGEAIVAAQDAHAGIAHGRLDLELVGEQLGKANVIGLAQLTNRVNVLWPL